MFFPYLIDQAYSADPSPLSLPRPNQYQLLVAYISLSGIGPSLKSQNPKILLII